jgi:hypothetical protein
MVTTSLSDLEEMERAPPNPDEGSRRQRGTWMQQYELGTTSASVAGIGFGIGSSLRVGPDLILLDA